ncbi:MAG: enoyl-CoA hydratase [Rhizobiaceae bacterium]|nr:enoyl-CoA hydratase [Rhizobiaceae bacterium]
MDEAAEPLVTREITDNILRLRLNNPGRANVLSEAMLDALREAFEFAENEKSIRVVILAANGRIFCSGHDLKELNAARQNQDGGRENFARTMEKCSALMQQIVGLSKPVIADIRAVASAAGCQLIASCDLALATEEAKFSTPGVNIGLFCSTPMVAISRNVSNKHAMEMLLTGDFINAQRAAEIGLINQALPLEKIDAALEELAAKIASKSAMTLAIGKKAFYLQKELPLAQAYEYTSSVMVENMMKQDADEGIRAFIEKRSPEWRDE